MFQDYPRVDLQRAEALHGDEPEAVRRLHPAVQSGEKQVGLPGGGSAAPRDQPEDEDSGFSDMKRSQRDSLQSPHWGRQLSFLGVKTMFIFRGGAFLIRCTCQTLVTYPYF